MNLARPQVHISAAKVSYDRSLSRQTKGEGKGGRTSSAEYGSTPGRCLNLPSIWMANFLLRPAKYDSSLKIGSEPSGATLLVGGGGEEGSARTGWRGAALPRSDELTRGRTL